VYRGGSNASTSMLRNSNRSTPHLEPIQAKVLVFQVDNEVDQEIDPNRNQMEEGNGLEIVATKDVEVRLSRGQPWKWNPMKPIDLIWIHKDMEQFRAGLGVNEGQSSSSKLANIKRNLGKRRSRIGIKIDSIRRREINCSSILPCDQSVRIVGESSLGVGLGIGIDRIGSDQSIKGRPNQSVVCLSNWKEVRSGRTNGDRISCIQSWKSQIWMETWT